MEIEYQNTVSIPADGIRLKGDLYVPQKAKGIVVFSHGSGSSRLSKRNIQIAKYLHKHDFGTLLFDLLTSEEDRYYGDRFEINLLEDRLLAATAWLATLPWAKGLALAFFGASTGAALALKASVRLPEIFAVVCRSGRTDLAEKELASVRAPTLLIVGDLDPQILKLNSQAYDQFSCEKRLAIIGGASQLFEGSGKLNKVAELAADWFKVHVPAIMV